MAAGGTRKPMILEISPRELRFTGNGNVHADTHLDLHNPSDKRVAFKVKTTAPRRYCVRPNSGVVEPSSSAKVGIVYQPVDQPQQSEITRHKFLIQALILEDGEDVRDELWRTAAQRSPEVIMESKMRVVFPDFVEGAGGGEHGGDNGYGQQPHLPGTASPYTGKESPDSGDVQRLLEENRRLKDENNTVKDEMKILKADRNELMKHAGKQGQLIGGAAAGGGGGGGVYGARRSVTVNEAMLSLQVQMVMLIIFVLGILFGKVFI